VSRRRWPSLKVALVASVVLVLVAATVYFLWSRSKRRAAAASLTPRSIAVLPFKPLGAESDNELLGLGMADALILKLSNLRRLPVLPTSSIFKYGGRERDALAIGRELGVDAVLDGTVQHAGESVRVTAQLINVADGKTLWSGKFDQRFQDIFGLQDSISEQLARALALQITPNERELFEKRYTSNTEAYQAYMTGVYFWNKRTKDGLTKAIEYFQRAIALDPNYAQAYAALSDCYNLNIYYRYQIVPVPESRQKMVDAAVRSYELDSNLAEANLAIATARLTGQDPVGAGEAYRRAIELNPNHAIARLRFANFQRYGLRLEPALKQVRKAQELDPTSPIINSALAGYLMQARLYDEAIKYAQRALELDPGVMNGRLFLGEAYVQKGMYDAAIEQYKMMKEEERPLAMQAMAYAYAVSGRRQEAQKLLAEILQKKDGEFSYYNIAMIYIGLGDHDRAFEWLEKERISPSLRLMLKYDPQLDPLRADPRFADYLNRRNIQLDIIGER
jgi:TolB-like protein/Flp pilus assembly protein TadD